MRYYIFVAVVLVAVLLTTGCTGKRLTEEQYVAQADTMLAKGNLEDAIYNIRSAVEYYPTSPKIADYRERLLNLILDAVTKYAGKNLAKTYIAEAITLVNQTPGPASYWIKFDLASRIGVTDSSAANKLFAEIPKEGFYVAARKYIERKDLNSAVIAYKKMLEIFPQEAGQVSDSIGYMLKFHVAVSLATTDPATANKMFSEISKEGYYIAAQKYLEMNDYNGSILAYKKLLEIYPTEPDNYKALFLIGFNYSEYVKNYENAKVYFGRVIKEYPKCDLASSAKWMISNMGKPQDEIKFLDSPSGKKGTKAETKTAPAKK